MKKFVILAFSGVLATGALASCKQQPAPEPAVSETATEAAAAMVTANGSPPGTYTATSADGTVSSTRLNGDGSYTDMDAKGKVTAEGSWAVKDGKTCFMPTTPGAKTQCFTESAPAPDGSFVVTSDSGEKQTIMPATSEASPSDAASASM